jgi:hypothetical protein
MRAPSRLKNELSLQESLSQSEPNIDKSGSSLRKKNANDQEESSEYSESSEFAASEESDTSSSHSSSSSPNPPLESPQPKVVSLFANLKTLDETSPPLSSSTSSLSKDKLLKVNTTTNTNTSAITSLQHLPTVSKASSNSRRQMKMRSRQWIYVSQQQ